METRARPEPGWAEAGRARCRCVGVAGAFPARQVTTTPVAVARRRPALQVTLVAVRVTPPTLLGRDLPEVPVATPEVELDTALP